MEVYRRKGKKTSGNKSGKRLITTCKKWGERGFK